MTEKQTDKGVRIEYVPLKEIQRWPRNPKLHDDDGLDAALERYGFVNPLTIDEKSGKLVDGHGRLEALQRWQAAGKTPPNRIAVKGQDWLVPVTRGISFKNENEAEAYLVATNRLVERGGWDSEKLSAVLSDLAKSTSLLGTGYEPGDVDAMYRELAAAEKPVVGATPAELTEKFQAAEIKQVVLYFEAPQYDAVVSRLETIQKQLGVQSNTEVFMKLLESWETNAVSKPAAN